MIAIAFAAALVVSIVAAAIAWSFARARTRALAEDVHRLITPYLHRKASEAGVHAEHVPWTARSQPEEIVTHAADLAQTLLEKEKASPAPATDIRQMALADTQQLSSDTVVTADLKNRKKPT